MYRSSTNLFRMCFEILGLTLAMSLVIVIATYRHFGGLGTASAQESLQFSVMILLLTAVPIEAYVVIRIIRLQARNGVLFDAATRDRLTGVMNRATFKKAVVGELDKISRRRSGEVPPFTFLMIEVDHVKRIKDWLGPAAGDRALTAIASVLQRLARKDDIVGRIGGEQFAVFLSGSSFDDARVVAERMRDTVGTISVGPKGHRMGLSVSIGGITVADRLPYDLVYRAADANLFKAKRNGQNRVDLSNFVRRVKTPGSSIGATRALSGSASTADLNATASTQETRSAMPMA